MLVLIIIASIIPVLAGIALGFHFFIKHRDLQKKYEELKTQRDSYVENIVERICVNESSLVEQRSLLDVSLAELERLAANAGSNWESIIERKPGNIIHFDPAYEDDTRKAPNSSLIEITQRIRNRFWSYIPDDRSHLGGTIQTIDDFIEFVKLSVRKFKAKKGIEVQLRLNTHNIDKHKYVFHDQDFIVRWFIFLSMFVRDSKILNSPPCLEINIHPSENKNSYHIKTAFILFSKNILPTGFNSQYKLFFHTGLLPDEWENLNPSLLEALKMSSVFSVIVRAEVNEKFGNTMIYFERDCYVVDDRKVFDQIILLRRKYIASKLNFVTNSSNNYEMAHLGELIGEMGMDIQCIPSTEFNSSLLSRTILVFISSDIGESHQKMIAKEILASPFSKVRVCIISKGDEKYKRIHHERVQYVEIPLTPDKLNVVL